MATFCPRCGKRVEQNDQFCPHCGNSMFNAPMNNFSNNMYYGYQEPTNGFAIAGFVCSFFIPILGIIFSCIGLSKAKQLNKGKELSIAGLCISIAWIVIAIILAIIGIASGDRYYYY